MKVITNKSKDVYNHALFMGLLPGYSVLVADDIAERLMEDHPDKFNVDDEDNYNLVAYEIVDVATILANTKALEVPEVKEVIYDGIDPNTLLGKPNKVGRPKK